MPSTRRQHLVLLGATLSGCLGGCLSEDQDSPTNDTTETPTERPCSATAPPLPDPEQGLPSPRSYPDGPPAFTEASVIEFVEQYERAYAFNALLADLVDDGTCVEYVEAGVVGGETTVRNADDGFEVSVTTRGSYTGTVCATATGSDTPTSRPHVDLPSVTAQYRITERFLMRDGTIYECW